MVILALHYETLPECLVCTMCTLTLRSWSEMISEIKTAAKFLNHYTKVLVKIHLATRLTCMMVLEHGFCYLTCWLFVFYAHIVGIGEWLRVWSDPPGFTVISTEPHPQTHTPIVRVYNHIIVIAETCNSRAAFTKRRPDWPEICCQDRHITWRLRGLPVTFDRVVSGLGCSGCCWWW